MAVSFCGPIPGSDAARDFGRNSKRDQDAVTLRPLGKFLASLSYFLVSFPWRQMTPCGFW
jgi:hypothetical protein